VWECGEGQTDRQTDPCDQYTFCLGYVSCEMLPTANIAEVSVTSSYIKRGKVSVRSSVTLGVASSVATS